MNKVDVTYIEKLNELRLEISHPNNNGETFVLLEGDTDVRLYRKLFDLSRCKVESVPGGNEKLEECVREIATLYTLIFGIRDADFHHLESSSYSIDGMMLTDYHDMEMGLIKNNEVWHSIMSEYGTRNNSEYDLTRKEILQLLEAISLLKWLNWRERLSLNFKGVGFSGCLDLNNWTVDFAQFFDRIVAKSPETPVCTLTDVSLKLDELEVQDADPYQLVNGHDFLNVLAAYFKKLGRGTAINAELLSSAIRIAYRPELFASTKLCAQILEWQANNGVSILAA